MDYRTLIGEIMAPAIRRYKEREARRAASESPSAVLRKTLDEQGTPAPATSSTATASSGGGGSGGGEPPTRMEAKA
jgi:D-alanine-D-alanine ligase